MSRRFVLLSASLFVLLTTMACQVGGLLRPAATPTAVPTPTAAPVLNTVVPQDPNEIPADDAVAITLREDDVAALVAQAEAEQQLTVTNLDVTFDDGTIELAAERLAYGPLAVNNLVLAGTVTALDGRPRLEVTRIEPNNLMTAAIPGLLTRLLESRTAGYYVEDITIDDGVMTIQIRP